MTNTNPTSNQPVTPGGNGENLASGFPLLPPAGGALTAAEIQLREAGAAFATNADQSMKKLAALTGLQNDAARAESYRAVGVYVSDLGTKLSEGVSDIGKRFSTGITGFSKIGEKMPPVSELLGSAQKKLKGLAGSAQAALFGTKAPASLLKKSEATAKATNEAISATAPAEQDRSHLVTLTNTLTGEIIEFVVMPEVVENRSVGYDPVAPPQFPGAFQKYKGTESVQWQMNATLIARTSTEATTNLKYMNWLRGWTMPFYGDHTKFSGRFKDKLGAPPPVLKLKGFRKAMIGEVPVVITSLSWNWPKDVDYIPATSPDGSETNIPFPTVIQLSIQLVESFSTTEFNQFDIEDYLKGNMADAYRKPVVGPETNEGNEGRFKKSPEQEALTIATQPVGTERGRGTNKNIVESAVFKPPVPPVPAAISELKKAPFTSGGGGDFGGGGATGRF